MNIITAPSVHLLAAPQIHEHPKYQLPNDGSPAERLIATGGKVCYDTYGVDGHPVERHVTNLVKQGHLAVVEHVHVSLFLEGISRGCSHEIVRHRLFNYSQRSTRYTSEDDAAIVLDPFYATLYGRPPVENTPAENVLLDGFLNQCFTAFDAYRHQIGLLEELADASLPARDRRKWCRGKARQLLPHALETRMVMTGNLRAWRHFLLMRTSRHAEAEIRRLAALIFEAVEPIAPTVFADLRRESVGGFVELVEQC